MTDPSGELSQVLRALLEGVPEPTARRISEQLWRSPRNPFTFAALGVALAELGQIPASLAAFERAHYLQPDSAHILYQYGLVLLAAQRPQEAALRFQAALRLSPGLEDARVRLAALEQSVPHGGPALDRVPRRIDAPLPRRSPPPAEAAPVGLREAESPQGKPQEACPAEARPARTPGHRPAVPTEPSLARSESHTQVEAEDHELTEWQPEPLPGFIALIQDALRTWGQQPLIWLGMLLVPNALAAAAVVALHLRSPWLVALIWTAALCAGGVPLLRAMASQYVYERPFGGPWRGTPLRMLRGALLTAPYLLLTVHLPCVELSRALPFPPEALLLATLLLGMPLHALFAPALIAAVTDGPSGFAALTRAFSLAGPRSWLHLAAMLATALILGGSAGVVSYAFTSVLHGAGSGVMAALAAGGVALGESVWAILVATCGVDALKQIAPPPDPDYAPPNREPAMASG